MVIRIRCGRGGFEATTVQVVSVDSCKADRHLLLKAARFRCTLPANTPVLKTHSHPAPTSYYQSTLSAIPPKIRPLADECYKREHMNLTAECLVMCTRTLTGRQTLVF